MEAVENIDTEIGIIDSRIIRLKNNLELPEQEKDQKQKNILKAEKTVIAGETERKGYFKLILRVYTFGW